MNRFSILLVSLLTLAVLVPAESPADPASPSDFKAVIFSCSTADQADFEAFAKRAKAAGATHITITGDLPKSYWQYDTPGDPYPAWAITHAGILKVAPPGALKNYLPADFAAESMKILEDRCRILRRLGLKASFSGSEPQMLPEKVFTDHPLWRGPRVDHPNRSRVARFAPAIDSPEILALYREATAELIKRCPEIELMFLMTNDSGTGLSWSGGLYSGRFGNSLYQNRSMDDRLRDYFAALQQGARDGGGSLAVAMHMTREADPARVVKKFRQGMAIENLEGPDATPFRTGAGVASTWGFYYPVVGIPQPIKFLRGLESAARSSAPRLAISLEPYNRDLYFRLYERCWANPSSDEISRLRFLLDLATEEVGAENAQKLLAVWQAIDNAEDIGRLLEIGGYICTLGGVHERWLTRPFVPFPLELQPEEKDYYRKFQFQARTEEHAADLADNQASRTYGGWSAKWFVAKVISRSKGNLNRGRNALADIIPTLSGESAKSYKLLETRLRAMNCVLTNANNAVSYQAQLDRVEELGITPEFRPKIWTESGWDRQMILRTAREEIDNTAVLMDILKSTSDPVLFLAPTKKEEDIRVLGPDIIEQMQKKINIMNAHWEDYKRIFTTPNL
jgi:hypothetical protein